MYLFIIYVKYVSYDPIFLLILIPSMGEKEVFWISKSICTNWAKFGKTEVIHKGLSNPSFNLFFTINSKFNSSRNHTKLLRFYSEFTHLGCYIKNTFMGNNQEVSIRVVKCLFTHRTVRRIVINSYSLFKCRLTSTSNCDHSFNKMLLLSFRKRWYRFPSQLIRMILNMFIIVKISQNFKVSF